MNGFLSLLFNTWYVQTGFENGLQNLKEMMFRSKPKTVKDYKTKTEELSKL